VNLNHLEFNFQELRKLAPKNEIIYMVKANAYGHGLEEIAHFAFEACGVTSLGVASLAEAIILRERFPADKTLIYVFSDTELSNLEYAQKYISYNLTPVISNIQDLENVLNHKEMSELPLTIKIDTGMNRLGISMFQLESLLETLKKHQVKRIDHLMSHFSSAYLKRSTEDMTEIQFNNFRKVKEEFSNYGIEILNTSMANSAAIEKGLMLDESHIRPGIMLYGPQSSMTGEKLWNGKVISSYETKILKKFKVSPGDTLGYGNHKIDSAGMVYILPIGYGDGFHTSYTGNTIFLDEYIGTVIGRVNMDLTYVFFSNDPGLKVDQNVCLWNNRQNSISRLEKSFKTISYELFCSLSIRIPRLYSLK
jgi:alanine racemase